VARADDLLRQAPQVLHQGHAEVDGHRPDLADGERLDALVRTHEALQRLQLEPAVGMGHVGPRQPVDPRIFLEVTLGDLRQQAVVAPREVIPDLPELFVHDEEVVEQPLLGRGNFALVLDRLDDVAVGGHQHASVLADPGEEEPAPAGLLGGALGSG
jgi:hypothetical protein